LNPAELKRNIVRLQSRLLRIGMRWPQAVISNLTQILT